jgi:hypothetical protein
MHLVSLNQISLSALMDSNSLSKFYPNNNVIANLFNRYIYLYWIEFLNVVSNDKCITRYFIDLKNNGRNIISSLQIICTIFISSLSMY